VAIAEEVSLARSGDPVVQPVFASEKARARYLHVLEHDLSSVGRPDPHLLELLAHGQPGRLRRHYEARLAACAQSGLHGCDDYVDIGDATVGDPGLRPVQRPGIGRLVVDGAGLQAAHVGAGIGLRDAERCQPDVAGLTEALRHPLSYLLRRAGGDDPGHAERRAQDRQCDPRVAPSQLFVDEREQEAGRVCIAVGDEIERVQPDPGRLLDDRPGRLFALVPFVRGRAHHILGKIMDPLDDLKLVLVQLHREVTHCSPRVRAEVALPANPAPATSHHQSHERLFSELSDSSVTKERDRGCRDLAGRDEQTVRRRNRTMGTGTEHRRPPIAGRTAKR
jgi:hypothetical protein